jgi:hypothetical protein
VWGGTACYPESEWAWVVVEYKVRLRGGIRVRCLRSGNYGLGDGELRVGGVEYVDVESTWALEITSVTDRCFETYLVSVSYFTSIVRSITSIPKALHAGPARLSRAVRPPRDSVKEWSEYPGQVETLNELTSGSVPNIDCVSASDVGNSDLKLLMRFKRDTWACWNY